MTIDLVQKALSRSSQVCLSLAVVAFVLFPTKLFQTWVGGFADRAQHFAPFLIFLFLAGSALSWLMSVTLRRSITLPGPGMSFFPLRDRAEKSRVTLVALAGSLLVLVLVAHNLGAPLHWEDNFHLSNIMVDPWLRFNPLIKTEHHTVASVPAFLSVKLLGFSKMSVKLPALLFTVTLLTVLTLFCRRYLSVMTTVIIFANLASNEMAQWFMHSMRGYIASMLMSFCALFVFKDLSAKMPKSPSKRTWLIFSIVLGCLFTHLFASLFCLLTIFSFLVWLCLNMENVERERRDYSLKLLGKLLLIAGPIYLFVFYHQALWLERLGDFFKEDFPDVSKAILNAMGISFAWPSRILILLVVGLACRRFLTEKKWYRDYYFLFSLVSVVFFVLVLKVLRVRMLETRFILPFLIPFLIWLGESIRTLKVPALRAALYAVTLGVLMLVPTKSARGLYDYLTLNVRDFDKFMKVATEKAAPLGASCFTYDGEPNLIYFARTLYLGELQHVKSPPDCRQAFHIHFQSPPELPPIDTRAPGERAEYDEIYNLDRRMVLYRERSVPSSRIVKLSRKIRR